MVSRGHTPKKKQCVTKDPNRDVKMELGRHQIEIRDLLPE